MNVELLLKVKEAIAANPERYDQSEFCGTTFCIAGHAVYIGERATWDAAFKRAHDEGKSSVYHAARRLLQMDDDDYESMTDPASCWPKPYNSWYWESRNPAQRAAVAGQIIDHFIRKEELKGQNNA